MTRARIDLSDMPGPRGRGEVVRFDLPAILDALVPQTVNRDAKRDREDVVEVPGMARGMVREALGQALLLGQGDDIEGYLTGRHPDDIRRERNAFADENRLAANAAYAGGLLAGGGAARAIKALASGPKQQVDDMPPRFEPDLRQAMRNADKAAPADEAAAQMRAQIEMLLNQKLPPRPEYFPGAMPMQSGNDIPGTAPGGQNDISPADTFAQLAGSPQSAVPALSAEEQALQALSPVDAVRFGLELEQATPVSDAQRAQNLRTTALDLLGVTPGPGNVMAAQDAVQGAKEAAGQFGQGNIGQGALAAALAALSGFGAVTGLPTSRAAGSAADAARDSAAVFLPLPSGSRAGADALARRASGQDLPGIYRDTGLFIGPDGTVRREIIDSRMMINPDAKAGTQMRLGDLIEHPQLFEARPQYRDIPVTLTNSERGGQAIARTRSDGGFENSMAGDMREGIAKNLQYQIARDDQLPAALRHGQDELPRAVASAIKALEGAPAETMADQRALARYASHLSRTRDEYERALSSTNDFRKRGEIEKKAGRRSAGNVDSRVVNARATFDAKALPSIYPYTNKPPYLPARSGKGVPYFDEIFVLPPETATGDDLMEFVRNWDRYGTGAPNPQRGGR